MNNIPVIDYGGGQGRPSYMVLLSASASLIITAVISIIKIIIHLFDHF